MDDSAVVQRFICASVHLGLLDRSADGKRLIVTLFTPAFVGERKREGLGLAACQRWMLVGFTTRGGAG